MLGAPVLAASYKTHWACITELQKSGSDSSGGPWITQRSKEKEFIWYEDEATLSRPGPVGKALFIFPAAYDMTRLRLRTLATAAFGEARLKETSSASFVDNYLETLDNPDGKDFQFEKKFALAQLEKQREKLKPYGIRLDGFRETTYTSDAYNKTWSAGWSSQLTLWVIDGADLFEIKSTLVVASRVDRGTIFGLLPHVGIPGFWPVRERVVTNTEYSLMAALARQLGVTFMVQPLVKEIAFEHAESWIAAKRWLQSQNTTSPELGAPMDIGRCPGAPARPPASAPDTGASDAAE